MERYIVYTPVGESPYKITGHREKYTAGPCERANTVFRHWQRKCEIYMRWCHEAWDRLLT